MTDLMPCECIGNSEHHRIQCLRCCIIEKKDRAHWYREAAIELLKKATALEHEIVVDERELHADFGTEIKSTSEQMKPDRSRRRRKLAQSSDDSLQDN